MTRKQEEFNFSRFSWLKISPIKIVKLVSIVSMFLLLSYAIYFFATLPDVAYLKNKNPKITALMQMRIDQAKAEKKKFKIRQRWIRYSEIPDMLKNTIRITEDASFFT